MNDRSWIGSPNSLGHKWRILNQTYIVELILKNSCERHLIYSSTWHSPSNSKALHTEIPSKGSFQIFTWHPGACSAILTDCSTVHHNRSSSECSCFSLLNANAEVLPRLTFQLPILPTHTTVLTSIELPMKSMLFVTCNKFCPYIIVLTTPLAHHCVGTNHCLLVLSGRKVRLIHTHSMVHRTDLHLKIY
jgi:hypothetical protein